MKIIEECGMFSERDVLVKKCLHITSTGFVPPRACVKKTVDRVKTFWFLVLTAYLPVSGYFMPRGQGIILTVHLYLYFLCWLF